MQVSLKIFIFYRFKATLVGMDYWVKQTHYQPIFEDILWSKPESRARAGKLLVIGGNLHGFSAVGDAYASAEKAGAGVTRILLPDALRKTVGGLLENTEFAPSTPQSGSFGREALNEFLSNSQWSDTTLLAGDLGRNSETSILLESYVQKYSGPLTIAKDAVDYFYNQPQLIADRENTTIVLSMAQLQRFGTALKFQTPFLLGMGLMLLVQALHDFTLQHQLTIVTKELDQIVVAHQGRVSSTKLEHDVEIWRTAFAARASVYAIQHPTKVFEAVTTSFCFKD